MKKFDVMGATQGQGGAHPPLISRTIPIEGYPVKRKNTIYFRGVGWGWHDVCEPHLLA